MDASNATIGSKQFGGSVQVWVEVFGGNGKLGKSNWWGKKGENSLILRFEVRINLIFMHVV